LIRKISNPIKSPDEVLKSLIEENDNEQEKSPVDEFLDKNAKPEEENFRKRT